MPEEAGDHLREFIADLTKRGLAGHELDAEMTGHVALRTAAESSLRTDPAGL